MNSDAQHLITALNIESKFLHPRNVSFCPAEDKSSESSPTADERTANLVKLRVSNILDPIFL